MDNMIRVLCVFSCLDRGGAETMCMNLYRVIDRTKIQFDFVKHTHAEGAYEKEIEELGGRIFEAPKLGLSNHRQYVNWWKKHLTDHPEHTIIHVHFFTITAAITPVAHQYDRIVVGHSHSCFPNTDLRSRIFKAIIKRGGKKVDYALACSDAAGRFMFGDKPYQVLKNAIDAGAFRYDKEKGIEARRELNIPESALVLGTVGRIEPVKNPSFMVEVFKRVCQKVENAYFVWVGDGSLRKPTEALFGNAGLSHNAVFTGVRSDVSFLLQAFDVFLLPSLHEGLPAAAIEAQAAGLCTLYSDNVPKEAAVTDRCDFLSTDDVDLWVNKILSLNTQKRDEYQAVAEAGYDIHTTALWLQSFYETILSKR